MPFEGMNFGLARPTVQVENPMDVAMKGLAMQGQQQQLQTGQLQQQQLQNQIQQQQAFQQGLQGVNPNDPNAIMSLLNRTGRFKEAQEFASAQKSAEAAKVGLQNEYMKMDQNTQSALKESTQAIGNAATAASKITDPVDKWNAWQGSLASLSQQFQPSPTDPPQLQQIKAHVIQQMQDESQGLIRMKSPTDLDALLKKHEDDAKTHIDWMKEAADAAANRKVMGVHADPNNNAFGVTAAGNSVQITDANGNPQKMKPPAGPTIQVNPGGNTDPAKFSSRAQMIADGIVQVPKPTRGDPNALQDVADAQKIMVARGEDPNNMNGKFAVVHQGQMSFAPGKINANVLSAVNTAADHTNNILLPAAKALNNGDWQTANAIGNKIGVNLGKNEATNFDSIATFLATEVAKVANGGTAPTLAEISEARKMFPTNGSNAQIQGAVDIANKVMQGKINSVELQHENAYGGQSITDRNLLTPEAINIFGKFQGKGKAAPTPGATGSQRVTATQADGTKLQLSADGKSWEPMGVK